MSQDNTFEWTITSKEKRKRGWKSVPIILTTLVPVALLGFFYTRSWRALLYNVLGIAIFLALFLIYNAIPKKERRYRIDENGIFVAKGKREKTYVWNELEYFLKETPTSVMMDANTEGLRRDELNTLDETATRVKNQALQYKNIHGQTYFLRKKPRNILEKIRPRCVVVYSEPNNDKQVATTMAKYIPQKTYGPAGAGLLVKFEFK